jgi:hypothetical protein
VCDMCACMHECNTRTHTHTGTHTQTHTHKRARKHSHVLIIQLCEAACCCIGLLHALQTFITFDATPCRSGIHTLYSAPVLTAQMEPTAQMGCTPHTSCKWQSHTLTHTHTHTHTHARSLNSLTQVNCIGQFIVQKGCTPLTLRK